MSSYNSELKKREFSQETDVFSHHNPHFSTTWTAVKWYSRNSVVCLISHPRGPRVLAEFPGIESLHINLHLTQAIRVSSRERGHVRWELSIAGRQATRFRFPATSLQVHACALPLRALQFSARAIWVRNERIARGLASGGESSTAGCCLSCHSSDDRKRKERIFFFFRRHSFTWAKCHFPCF